MPVIANLFINFKYICLGNVIWELIVELLIKECPHVSANIKLIKNTYFLKSVYFWYWTGGDSNNIAHEERIATSKIIFFETFLLTGKREPCNFIIFSIYSSGSTIRVRVSASHSYANSLL